MEPQEVKRKLTAILSADVKGYSRLMSEDEKATIRTVTTYREVMATLIEQRGGRVVDATGDNLLAEFASVVDAVQCAVEIQEELRARNAQLPENRRMEFRIGINLGDVIVEGDRIYGDGVNIAARVESLAEGGGLCISGTAYDQIEGKLTLGYESLGEQTVKNIKKPVRVYRVRMGSEAAGSLRYQKRRDDPRYRRRAALALAAVLVVGAVALTMWNFFWPPSSPSKKEVSEETRVLGLPDKPSIAVLPFTNLSGDPEQEYFSDGMTDDLITDLSRLRGTFVIARHSVFTYKGKAVKVGQVGRELGVRYVLEGSVRRAAGKVRINIQLVDAATGGHLWAGRYDRDLKDIFALQDEIAQKIVFALKVTLTPEEQARFRRYPTDNLEAYDSLLRGGRYISRLTKEANAQARQGFERAIELDPGYGAAYAALGWTYVNEWILQWSRGPQALERASELAQKAIALDDSLPIAHGALGTVYRWKDRQPEQAIAEYERAIALDPNDAEAYVRLADILQHAGRAEEAIGLVQKAMRLNPRYPDYYLFILSRAYRIAERYEEAIATLKQALIRNPNFWMAYTDQAVIYLGQWMEQRSQDPQTLQRALEAAQKAVALNDSASWAHLTLGFVYLWKKQYEQAIAEHERAIALDPDDDLGFSHAAMGISLNAAGRTEEAIGWVEKTPRLSPLWPGYHSFASGLVYHSMGRFEEAIAALKKALTAHEGTFSRLNCHLYLAASYSASGRQEEARAEAAEVLKINPRFSLEVWRQRWPYKDPADLERFIDHLRKAGLE